MPQAIATFLNNFRHNPFFSYSFFFEWYFRSESKQVRFSVDPNSTRLNAGKVFLTPWLTRIYCGPGLPSQIQAELNGSNLGWTCVKLARSGLVFPSEGGNHHDFHHGVAPSYLKHRVHHDPFLVGPLCSHLLTYSICEYINGVSYHDSILGVPTICLIIGWPNCVCIKPWPYHVSVIG